MIFDPLLTRSRHQALKQLLYAPPRDTRLVRIGKFFKRFILYAFHRALS